MNLVIVKNNKKQFNKTYEFFIHVVSYIFLMLLTEFIFKKSLYIDKSNYFIWVILTAIVIYILNKTVKPIIFILTLPITGLTLGLFYPFINVIILYLVSFIMGNHFDITGILSISGFFVLFIMAIFISIMNLIIESKIIKPALRMWNR